MVIPGIMGTVLQRGDDVLWNPGPGMAAKLLTRRQWIESLVLPDGDEPSNPMSPDGVTPVGLAASHTIVPGLFSIDGYSQLHSTIVDGMSGVIEGDPLDPEQRVDGRDPARSGVPNYYRFGYDWRRDLRSASLRLHELIDTALPRLRQQRSPEAEVIIIGHSMGGLVARYYLYGINPATGEPFDGWRNVREVFTMGTPYRGSADAFVHLVSGFRKLFVDFSEALRSFTGVYQLLPRYRMVRDLRAGVDRVDGGDPIDHWRYPHEIEGLAGFSPMRARAVYDDLHGVIDRRLGQLGLTTSGPDAESPGRPPTADPAATPSGAVRGIVVPNIGFGHRTNNSVVITDEGATISRDLPDYLDSRFAGGDGTVPLISAIPPEYDRDRAVLRYTNQRHGSLQVDQRLLAAEVRQRLAQAQAGTRDALDPGRTVEVSELPAVGIDGPNYFLPGETAFVELDTTGTGGDVALTVSVVDLVTGRPVGVPRIIDSPAADGEHTPDSGSRIDLPSEPGEYRVEVTATSPRLASQSMYAVLEDGRGGGGAGRP